MSGTIERSQRARKEHVCSHCKQPIPPGSIYVTIANPPWNDCEGDVDDEGRPIYALLPPAERRWYVEKLHQECEWERWA